MAAYSDAIPYDRLDHFVVRQACGTAPRWKLPCETRRMTWQVGDGAWLIIYETALPKKTKVSCGIAPQ